MFSARLPRPFLLLAALLGAAFTILLGDAPAANRQSGWSVANALHELSGSSPRGAPVILPTVLSADADGDPDDELASRASDALSAPGPTTRRSAGARAARLSFGVADGPGATGPPSA